MRGALLGWMLALGLLVALPGCPADDCVCDDDNTDDDDATGDDDSGDDDSVDPDDRDGDGWTVAAGDCDDDDPARNPGVEEVCDDGVDGDCDGVEDDGCTVDVPADDLEMGSDEQSQINPGMFIAYWDERPVHLVHLSAYRIDRHEVTNLLYRRCVDAGECAAPGLDGSATRPDYFSSRQYDGYPVIGVTWAMAEAYCAWRGGRLPTEAEWEMGAKGPSPSDIQAPWGHLAEIDDWYADCDKANYGLCEDDTTRVGSYPDGVSPLGLYDMTGNVAEWVGDWYHVAWYGQSPQNDPTGPDDGRFRVLRGGMWKLGWFDGRTVRRKYIDPEFVHDGIGFRCAYDGA